MSSHRRLRLHDPPESHFPHLNGNAASPADLPLLTPGPAPASPATQPPSHPTIQKLDIANEGTWLLIGQVAQSMGDLEHAQVAYDHVLRHNPASLAGLTHAASVARIKENYPKAIDHFQHALALQETNGEVWSALGHCYLMQDDLQKAYAAYQQALYILPNPKEDPKLWYGIGILYDRYGSLDHAEEAFASVLRMSRDLDLDKENEILFRLGIIYKQQMKYADALQCFDRILRNPPSPLAHADIWFQIGHVYEQQKDLVRAKDAYEKVVADNPMHAKVLQQLGWLYHQDESSFQNQDIAIQYLTKSLEADPADAQSWYLLGRAYMAGSKYNKAYEAYQQAVYRDGRNPTFWCSIGVLYFQINQFRDALDAYSRAIRINPYISEVWFDLGTLYESCNNQISDAIDAYARAHELDRGNTVIAERLQLLRGAQATGAQLPAAPGPQDVHPTAYANAIVAPPGLSGPPPLSRQLFGPDSRGPGQGGAPDLLSGPPSGRRTPPGPFRGGPPPPVIIDDNRHSSPHTHLAPMDVDRVSHVDLPPTSREHGRGGPANSHSILLHQPLPQPLQEDIRRNGHSHRESPHHENFYSRPPRPLSASTSPTAPHHRSRQASPPPYTTYPPPAPIRHSVPPGQSSSTPTNRSPRGYSYREPHRRSDSDAAWDRRPAEPREYERRPRAPSDLGPPPPGYYAPHSPESRPRSPEQGHMSRSASAHRVETSRHHYHHSPPEPQRRYDPRMDARDHRDHAREEIILEPGRGSAAASPMENRRPHPSSHYSTPALPPRDPRDESRPQSPSSDTTGRRRSRAPKDKDAMVVDQPLPQPKKERKKRQQKRTTKEDGEPGPSRGARGYSQESPEPTSSSHSSSKPSPTSGGTPHSQVDIPRHPARVVDEDYDEGVAEALVGLSSTRNGDSASASPYEPNSAPASLPPMSSGGRHPNDMARPPPPVHRASLPVNVDRSPTSQTPAKRPLSPTEEDDAPDHKRSRSEAIHRSPTHADRHTPTLSTRPSPIPFRTQPPTSRSPEARPNRESITTGASTTTPTTTTAPTTATTYPGPSSPSAVPKLPPHPRPVGTAGLSSSAASHASAASVNNTSSVNNNVASSNSNNNNALPPIATLSPGPGSDAASPPPSAPSSIAPAPGAATESDHERDQQDEMAASHRSEEPTETDEEARKRAVWAPRARTPPVRYSIDPSVPPMSAHPSDDEQPGPGGPTPMTVDAPAEVQKREEMSP